MLSRRRQQKLSAAIIHECPAIGRDVRLRRLGCYFSSRVLRKRCAGALISANVADDTAAICIRHVRSMRVE